ncbi:hypothetical protein P22_1620 [Propionispora sp. 2/2-37]|uniref:response regulator transcription factor n=1 Tax=Propionispora sp. 2/2-37 TaxID=1677858 RepID=UPI0006BB727F|nr:response regulator transcription factor [Propionispora sp. 2/2-37]CUH95549.1 hypothetical protein P22_1620 [Propionispora sp. 2/2-37]
MHSTDYKIYLVGSKPKLNCILTTYLQTYGWTVESFLDCNKAFQHIDDNPDLWVIDVIHPSNNDNNIVKQIKTHNNVTPVILIFDPKIAFEKLLESTEYDDYVIKPFSPLELIMRAQKLIENKLNKRPDHSKIIYYNGYEINSLERLVSFKGKTINLTTKEFELVYLLVSNLRRTFSKEQLIKNIWVDDYSVSDRAVYDLISRARAKLKALKITTVYGYGYKAN